MSTDRRHRVLRLFSSLVVAAALAAPVAAAADGSDATLRNDEAHYGRPSASEAPSPTVLNDTAHNRSQGARGPAVSGSGHRSRRGRLRLDLRGRRRRWRIRATARPRRRPPSRCADASTSTLHRPDAPSRSSTPVRGRPQAALFTCLDPRGLCDFRALEHCPRCAQTVESADYVVYARRFGRAEVRTSACARRGHPAPIAVGVRAATRCLTRVGRKRRVPPGAVARRSRSRRIRFDVSHPHGSIRRRARLGVDRRTPRRGTRECL